MAPYLAIGFVTTVIPFARIGYFELPVVFK